LVVFSKRGLNSRIELFNKKFNLTESVSIREILAPAQIFQVGHTHCLLSANLGNDSTFQHLGYHWECESAAGVFEQKHTFSAGPVFLGLTEALQRFIFV